MAKRRYDDGVYVAAARTRITSDRLLGRASPHDLVRLAAGDVTVLRPEEPDDPAEAKPDDRQPSRGRRRAGDRATSAGAAVVCLLGVVVGIRTVFLTSKVSRRAAAHHYPHHPQ